MHEVVRESALQSALGLTTTEAENAFALSVVETKGIDHKIVARKKARTLKRNGLVEVVEATTSLDDIGGLNHLKEWLMRRAGAFSESAKSYGLPAPKGLLSVGIPGTGKSLMAKATAGAFGLPLLRLDMGCVFGGIIGQPAIRHSNRRGHRPVRALDRRNRKRLLRQQVQWFERQRHVLPRVRLVPELDAGEGKAGVCRGDGQRCVQTTTRVPTQGRFDEMFFVDLPDALERAQIWDIVTARHGRRPTDYDAVVLARACEQFTGAEIKAVFIDTLHEAYADGREPGAKDILDAMTRTVPLAQLMAGQIAGLKHWAEGRAREAASRSTSTPRNGRRMSEAN